MGEIGIADEAHGVFLCRDDDAVFAAHRMIALDEQLDVLAGIVVVVGEDVDFDLGPEALEIAYEGTRIADAGDCKHVVLDAHIVEEGHRAHVVGKEGHEILIGKAREEKILTRIELKVL